MHVKGPTVNGVQNVQANACSNKNIHISSA